MSNNDEHDPKITMLSLSRAKSGESSTLACPFWCLVLGQVDVRNMASFSWPFSGHRSVMSGNRPVYPGLIPDIEFGMKLMSGIGPVMSRIWPVMSGIGPVMSGMCPVMARTWPGNDNGIGPEKTGLIPDNCHVLAMFRASTMSGTWPGQARGLDSIFYSYRPYFISPYFTHIVHLI